MNILALGSHPDDVEFYCAGTLMKYARAGHRIFIALTTSGNQGSNLISGRDEIGRVREAEQLEAAKAYTNSKGEEAQVRFLRFDDQALSDTPELRRAILAAMRWARPDVIFTQFVGDMSTDHAVTGDLVGRLMLSLPGKNIDCGEAPTDKVPSLFYWDAAAGLHFEPEAYVDISGEIEDKIAALALHKSQFAWMENFEGPSLTDHSRILSQFRGLANGTKYAEGFRAYRIHGFMANFRLLP